MLSKTEAYWFARAEEVKLATARSLVDSAEWVVAADNELELGSWRGKLEDLPGCDLCGRPGAIVAKIDDGGGVLRTASVDDLEMMRPATLICRTCLHR